MNRWQRRVKANNIPEGWTECKLRDIADIKMGQSPKSESYNNSGEGLPFLQGSRTFGSRYPLIDTYCTDPKRIANKGEILFSVRAPVGDINIAHRKICIGRGLASLNAKNQQNLFLFYLLHFIKDDIINLGNGTVFESVNKSDLESVSILLPPLPEQRAIASVLSSIDDKIDLLQRENKTLEAMAETLFRRWFIEEAEDDWEEVPLSDVFDFKEGPGIRNWQFKDKGIPFINIRLISDGEIDVSKANFIDEKEANEKYKQYFLQEKDMVVSTSGTLGKIAIVKSYHLPLLLNTSVIRFRPKDGISYAFMYGYLNSKQFREQLIKLSTGSVQLNFGPMHLKQITIQLPPKEKREYFEEIVNPIYDKIESNHFQIRTLTQLRDTLLPKLMSGEVRVDICQS